MEAKICQFLHQWSSTRPLQNSSTIGLISHIISYPYLFCLGLVNPFHLFWPLFLVFLWDFPRMFHHLDILKKRQKGVHLDHFHMTHPRGQLYRSFTTTFFEAKVAKWTRRGETARCGLVVRVCGAKLHPPKQISSNWWLNQPIWKIWSSNWIISPNSGGNKKYLKPPPRISSYHSWKKPLPTIPWDSNHH